MLIPLVLGVWVQALPIVDPGVVPLETCRIDGIGFADSQRGWMADLCGRLFHSTDGGKSWTRDGALEARFWGKAVDAEDWMSFRPHVQHWLWRSDQQGIAFTYGLDHAFRTEDGGRTWTPLPLPSGSQEMLYAVEHLGESIWYCGSTGRVTRSVDGGRTWSVSEPLFEKAAINPSNWCSGIAFLDASDGWVAGWRTLNATDDGGRTWRTMPALPLESDEQVRELVRLSRRVAWAASRQRVFRTKDGGSSWTVVPLSAGAPQVAHRKDGRTVLVRQAPDPDPEAWVPLLDDSAFAVGGTDVIARTLSVWSKGALIRSGPPVTAPSGNRVQLVGVSGAYGWAGRRVFRSDDSSRSWMHVGELPGDVVAGAQVNDELMLLKTKDGALHASTDGGRTWVAASIPDAIAWGKRTGEERVRPEQRIECVLGAARVELTVEYGVSGCFGGTKDELVLRADGTGATLRGSFDRYTRESSERIEVNRRLMPAAARAALETVVRAATREERPSRCSSTNRWFSRVSFACDGATATTLDFETNDCADRGALEVVGASTSTGGRTEGDYRRAIGIGEAASALVR